MINRLHARMHRPERGWDPVPPGHASTYAENEWCAGVREELLDELDTWVGGLEGKRVLDLGGGAGPVFRSLCETRCPRHLARYIANLPRFRAA